MKPKNKGETDEKVAEILERLREINRRAKVGEIDEFERIRLHEEISPGLGELIINRGWDRS